MRKLNVLSLCDGMSCGQITLNELEIEVNNYYASEIKEIAIKVTKDNFPETIHIGDLTKISYKDGILHTETGDYETDIDMVIFGSPCQTFSIACRTEKRIGLEDEMKSGLFLHCHRILKEVEPKLFFMENVASMENEDRDFISELMGVNPYKINADKVSPALRKRYYWTNLMPGKIQEESICLNDILEHGWSDRSKARCITVSDSRPNTTPAKMFHRYFKFTTLIFKSEEHYKKCVEEYKRLSNGEKITAKHLDGYTGNVFDGVRHMNQNELEKCQCVPPGYTKCLTRNESADVLGDGWNIGVIKGFFEDLKNYGY